MLKTEIKNDLMFYYDTIQSEIDIEVQRQILKLEKSGLMRNINAENKILIEKNEFLIDQVKAIFDVSINQID